MTDNLNPTGPSQPTLNQAYTTPGNPADTEPAERRGPSSGEAVDKRTASNGDSGEATPSSLGQGVRRPNAPGEEANGETQASVGRHNELDAEQMAAPGEGKVAAAVSSKPGASGSEPGFEEDLEAKKAEQASARAEVKEDRAEKVDVAGVLGQRGGPANPVDKDGYPNSGSA